MEVFDFVGRIWQDFWNARPIEQAGFLIALAGLPLISWLLAFLRLRNSRSLIDQLRGDATALAAERDRAERRADAERANAELWMPDVWMDTANHERAQGSEERAIAALREGFERVRGGVGRASLALAGHHLCLTVGPEPVENLIEGERQARLAALLEPGDADAAFLVEEAELMKAAGEEAVSVLEESFLPSSEREASAVINAIRIQVDKHHKGGRFRIGLRLCRRALLIVRRATLVAHEIGRMVEYDFVTGLYFCGEFTNAHRRVDALLTAWESSEGPEHLHVLATYHLKARILARLGEYQQALGEVRRIMPIRERVLGAEHPAVLAARCLEAQILSHLGANREALEKIIEVLPVFERILGFEHPETLATCFWEALTFDRVGEHQQALDRVEKLLPTRTRIQGRLHPHVLATSHLEAEILSNLGNHRQGLDKVVALLSMSEGIQGPAHADVLSTRALEAKILYRLGEHRQALDKVRALLPVRERIEGAEHPDVRATRALEAQILDSLDEHG